MATQRFKRNLLLNLYREGKKYHQFVSSCHLSEVKLLSHVQLFATPWTVAYQAPSSMGFSKQEYWSGLPLRLREIKMSDTYSLFPPFGDPWPSLLLPSQKLSDEELMLLNHSVGEDP